MVINVYTGSLIKILTQGSSIQKEKKKKKISTDKEPNDIIWGSDFINREVRI